ncbi:hypothetical protein Tco_1086636 [Tanacetum coccineum]
MGWVVCSDAVVESCDAVLVFVVTASRYICDAVSSHCREILDQCHLLVTEVDDTLMRMVDSLESWNAFPWGEHISMHLYDEIMNVVSNHKSEHLEGLHISTKCVPTYTLSGFVWAFKTDMNDLESNDESVDTLLVSPFPHSDNDSDNGEVLNELIEYENVGMLHSEREINSFDEDDLAFQCMIGFRKFVAYFDPFLPINIITRKAYNTIMVEELESTAVMSSASSAVTYTSVYTDSEPGRAFWGADDEEISEGGIPRVIVLGYDGLPIQPVAPPSPDYIPGPEDPQTPPVP